MSVSRKRSDGSGGRPPGFTCPEMAFLLLVVALFLGGTVWVSSGAVTKSPPSGGGGKAGEEGERAMDRIEALVRSGRKFFYPDGAVGSSAGKFVSGSLEFLADLDGDPATGRFVLDGARGFERVLVFSRGSSAYARVCSSPGGAPREVALARGLAGDGTPFVAALRVTAGKPGGGSGPLRVKEVRIRMVMTLDGGRTALTRKVVTGSLPPFEPAPPAAHGTRSRQQKKPPEG